MCSSDLYDAKGRPLETRFALDDYKYTTVCSYDDGSKMGTCVRREGDSVSETRVSRYDADERLVEVREYRGATTEASGLRARTVLQWRSDRCPLHPDRVSYGDAGASIGRFTAECDADGRVTRERWYGQSLSPGEWKKPDLLVREERTEYDDERQTQTSTVYTRDEGDDALQTRPDLVRTVILDDYGQAREARMRVLPKGGDPAPGDRVTVYDYGCWGEKAAETKGVGAAQEAKALKTLARPMMRSLAGRWNFVADDGEKMVFLLEQGKIGIVDKGEYSEVAAAVLRVDRKSLTLRVSPPAGTTEAPLTFEVRMIDDKSIVVSTPGQPDKKGRMYVR